MKIGGRDVPASPWSAALPTWKRAALHSAATRAGYAFRLVPARPAEPNRVAGRDAADLPALNRWGAYIHDDWKVTPRLTVNLGLALRLQRRPHRCTRAVAHLGFPRCRNSRLAAARATRLPAEPLIPTIFPEFVDERGAVKLFQQDVKFFMPRIGIAWRPTEKWVIKGRRRVVRQYQPPQYLDHLQPDAARSREACCFNRRLSLRRRCRSRRADGATYPANTRQYHGPVHPILTLNDPFLQAGGATATVRPINLILPAARYQGRRRLEVELRPPAGAAVPVRADRWICRLKGHARRKQHRQLQLAGSVAEHEHRSRGVRSRTFYDPATPQLGVQAIGNIRYIDSYGESFYHGLQAKVDKRFSRGLAFGSSYTFSKSHGDGENGGQEGAYRSRTRATAGFPAAATRSIRPTSGSRTSSGNSRARTCRTDGCGTPSAAGRPTGSSRSGAASRSPSDRDRT